MGGAPGNDGGARAQDSVELRMEATLEEELRPAEAPGEPERMARVDLTLDWYNLLDGEGP